MGSWLPTGYERGREGRFGGEGPCPSFLEGMRGWVFYTLKNKLLLLGSRRPMHPNGSPWAGARPRVGASTVPAVGAAGTRRTSGTGTWGQKVLEPQFPARLGGERGVRPRTSPSGICSNKDKIRRKKLSVLQCLYIYLSICLCIQREKEIERGSLRKPRPNFALRLLSPPYPLPADERHRWKKLLR